MKCCSDSHLTGMDIITKSAYRCGSSMTRSRWRTREGDTVNLLRRGHIRAGDSWCGAFFRLQRGSTRIPALGGPGSAQMSCFSCFGSSLEAKEEKKLGGRRRHERFGAPRDGGLGGCSSSAVLLYPNCTSPPSPA